jgi:photosystem II stability/assembly factor-like uncharacterized protein
VQKSVTYDENAGHALRTVAALAIGIMLLTSTGSATANGRFPAANRILLSPTNPDLVIVRATYGILPSFDDGRTWRFLCEDALGLPQSASSDPALGLTANSALIAGLLLPAGLEVSADTGCNWSCAGGLLANEMIADVVVRPDAPHTVLALTATVYFDDAGGGQHSQVVQSSDDGSHWAAVGAPIDPRYLVTTLEVAPSDAHRLYVSAANGFAPTRNAVLFVSANDGSWIPRPVPLDARYETNIYIGGVDPADADRVYIRTDGDRSRLLVTTNAGQSFAAVLNLTGPMLGFALSPDGAKIYAGSVEDGLFAGDRASMTFARQSLIRVRCLAARGTELWACSDESSGFFAGVSTDQGVTFSPKLHPDSVQAPIACAASARGAYGCGADANAAQCGGPPYERLCATLGCQSGPADASVGSRPPSSSATCKCSLVGGGRRPGFGVAALSVLVAAATVRRKSRHLGHRSRNRVTAAILLASRVP